MRRLALVFLAAAPWLGSVAQAQSRTGSQCAGNMASASSAMSLNGSPGSSAFGGTGGGLATGVGFGNSAALMMGAGSGANVNSMALNGMMGGWNSTQATSAFMQGGNGYGGFNSGYGSSDTGFGNMNTGFGGMTNGFGMGAMNDGFNNGFGMGAMNGQTAMNSQNASGSLANDPETSGGPAMKASSNSTPNMPLTRSKKIKSKAKPKAKTATTKTR